MSDELNDYIKAERDFLHDLSTPLMVLEGQLSFLESLVGEAGGNSQEILEKLKKAQVASEKISTLVKDRRTLIKSTST